MGLNQNSAEDACGQGDAACACPDANEIHLNSQRILACTARALAATPGGLRFKPGSRPWLDGVADASPLAAGKDATAGRTACAARNVNGPHPPKAPLFGAFFHFATPSRLSPAQGA